MKSRHSDSGYLSASGYNLYLRDPQLYFERYVLGIPQPETAAMKFGKIFSKAFSEKGYDYKTALIEAGYKQKHVDMVKKWLSLFPPYDYKHCEHEIKVPFTKSMNLLGYLDYYQQSRWHIVENKTGGQLWDKHRVASDNQLTFYALMHWLKYEIPPHSITLNWFNPHTGRSYHFKTTRTVAQIKQFAKNVEYVIDCIEAGQWEKQI